MKRSFLIAFTVLAAICLVNTTSLFAGAYDDAESTYSDPSTFDGGSGSTLNEPGWGYDSSVPDVGESGPISSDD